MKLQDLKPNPENPRKITDAKLSALRKTLKEYGDLSGFIYNRKTKRLVSGHQRRELLRDAEIIIEREHKKPTQTGTVAEGHVAVDGERFSYREVFWDEFQEKAAALAANQNAGSWDEEQLTAWFQELDDYGFDLDLTMFDELEREDFLGDGAEEPKLKKPKSPGDSKLLHECPNCGHQFSNR